MHKPLFALLLALCSLTASSKDLGVQGNTWPIVERDMRQLMMESAMKTDWTAANNKLKDNAQTYLSRLPKRKLPKVDATRTDWMDPSIELKTDIQTPYKKEDGSLAWKVLAPKGTRVNPMTQHRPVVAMFMFDGSDEEQVKLLRSVLALEPDRIMPVEAGAGDLKTVSDLLQRPIFYANDAIISRFQVRYLPALVYPGYGQYELYMGITSFAVPASKGEDVIASWPDLRPPAPTAPRSPK